MRIAKLAAPALIAAVSFAGSGCYSTFSVHPTTVDENHLRQVESEIPQDDFFVPGVVRFVGPLLSGGPITTNPSLSFSGRGNKYEYPVFEVVREACAIAVRRSFKPVNEPPKAFLRDDALEVEFSLRDIRIEHHGGDGEAHCRLELNCQVKYPAPSTYVVATFPVHVDNVVGQLNEDGTGAGGPGVLWVAAGEAAKKAAELLRGPEIRGRFAHQDDYVAWRSNVDGHAPPDQQRPKFDLRNTWGEYKPVVVLR